MSPGSNLGLLFLHALPLDGSMWGACADLLPGSTDAPDLYGLGDTVEDWAAEVLKAAKGERLIVVGCSVGGSCAIEVAAAAPGRVAALVLIGTKAGHSPDPKLHAEALDLIEREGLAAAWERYWEPLFSQSTDRRVVEAARSTALAIQPEDIAHGVTAFHSRPSRALFVSKCPIPMTVVTGEDDVAPGLQSSAALAAAAPRGSLHVIPSCGHYVPLERPDALRAILKDVIESQA